MSGTEAVFADFIEGDYVWIRREALNRWAEARVLNTAVDHLLIHTLGESTTANKNQVRIEASEEAARRSCWPGEEQRTEYHPNLTDMHFLNSPEVAANISLGLDPDSTLLVRGSWFRFRSLYSPPSVRWAMPATLLRPLPCGHIAGTCL